MASPQCSSVAETARIHLGRLIVGKNGSPYKRNLPRKRVGQWLSFVSRSRSLAKLSSSRRWVALMLRGIFLTLSETRAPPGASNPCLRFIFIQELGGAASPRQAGTCARRVQIWRFRIESVYVCRRSGSVFRHVFASISLRSTTSTNSASSWVITTLLSHSRDTPMASPLTPHVSSGFPDVKPKDL